MMTLDLVLWDFYKIPSGQGGMVSFKLKREKKSINDDFNNFQAAENNEMVDAPT